MKNLILNHFKGNYQLFFQKYFKEFETLSGDEHRTICPFHEDKNPSLSFNNKTGQWYCHGCKKGGDIFKFYGKLYGVNIKHDFRELLIAITEDFKIPNKKRSSNIVETYDYLNADSDFIFQVCRKEPKEFIQRRIDGNGDWIYNSKGIKPVLYRLPDVLKADEVIIVEGEKDADNLSSIGFTATTNPMGAKKWKPEYSNSLKGKDVVLIPDNDSVGREHMTRVAQSLKGNARSLKWIDLPDLPDKGDVSDFIAGFDEKKQAAERLAIMIDQAGPYEPPNLFDPPHQKVTFDDVILPADQFYQLDVPERQELLFPWLKEDSINLVSGWRGCGKTWFALGVLDAVTKGSKFGPWECKKPVPCLFLDGEMTVSDDHERIESLRLDSERAQPLYFYSDAYANRLGLPRADLADESWRKKMKQILIALKIKLWVVDNLASLASGLDENKKQDWDPINSWLMELRVAGISTLMIHHEGKDGGQRGTSAREDNVDISITLKKPYNYVPQDGARLIVHFNKARIKTSRLNLIRDTEFKLILDESDNHVWTYKNALQDTMREVIKMIDSGIKQKAIAETLSITKGYVSQLKKRAIEEGLLTTKGKLTPDGIDYVSTG